MNQLSIHWIDIFIISFLPFQQLHEDTQRHLVGMRLANKPVDEIETFQQESNQCFQQLQNGNSVALKSDEIVSSPTDLKRIETVLNALAEDLRRRNDLAIPNQISALEVVLREHKVSFQLYKFIL